MLCAFVNADPQSDTFNSIHKQNLKSVTSVAYLQVQHFYWIDTISSFHVSFKTMLDVLWRSMKSIGAEKKERTPFDSILEDWVRHQDEFMRPLDLSGDLIVNSATATQLEGGQYNKNKTTKVKCFFQFHGRIFARKQYAFGFFTFR